jgi:hypothetical protein
VIQYTTFLSTWYQSTGSESPYIYFLLFSAYIFSARLVFSGKYFALSFSVLFFLLVVSADQYTAGNLGRRPFQSCRTQPNRSSHAPSRAARSSPTRPTRPTLPTRPHVQSRAPHAPPRAYTRPHASPRAPRSPRAHAPTRPTFSTRPRAVSIATSALATSAVPRQPSALATSIVPRQQCHVRKS